MPPRETDLRRDLSEALEKLGITQQDFAERAGISQAAVSKILDGQTSGKRVQAKILETIEKSKASNADFTAELFDLELRKLLARALEAGLVSDGHLMTELVQRCYLAPEGLGESMSDGRGLDSEDEEMRMDDPFANSSEQAFDVMISYNGSDYRFAHTIYTYLSSRDIPGTEERLQIWVDFMNLLPGTDFESEIPNVFSKIQLAVVLVGPSGESEWVAEETKYAKANEKRIIPVLIGEAQAKNKDLLRLTPLKLKSEADAEGLNKLFWAILRWCNKKTGVA